jgi:glycine/D-amino acid oxidase-like deaminating enzyme
MVHRRDHQMTRTQYGISPWMDEFPRRRIPALPVLRGSHAFPVVIIGGGLAGCLTACAFAVAGVKVALVEADRIGRVGGAGPGVLHGEAAPSYREIEARHGRRAARAMFGASRRAVLDLAAFARRLGIKGVEPAMAARVVASFGEDDRSLSKEAASRRDAGLDAMWLAPAAAARESGIEMARGAVRFQTWGLANPYRLVVAVARAAAERGAAFFERSPVGRVKAHRAGVEVVTEGGALTAETVIVCTGEPTRLFRPLERHLRREDRYLVLTERLPAPVRRALDASVRIVMDAETPPHTIRWTADGRLLVAGADQPRVSRRGKEKVLIQRSGQLMYELSRLYPAVSGVMPTHGWDLPIATTADGAMYAGPHRNYPRHLFAFATRHDPAQAFLASRILLRHYLGRTEPADHYMAFTRG